MASAIFFKPLYMERVWGGRGLESKLGRPLPENQTIGESWEVVDRPEAQSVVEGGSFHGLSVRDLITRHSDTVMALRDWATSPAFLSASGE